MDHDEQRKLLYTYWNDLPYRKDVTNFFQVVQSDVKHFIIKYIRDGIEDEFGQKNGLLRRHAFSVKELKDAYEKSEGDTKYSISNFHFHINSLVKEGWLKEVAKILEGRHYINHYGRTAKAFYPEYAIRSQSMTEEIFDPLTSMIKKMNPELNTDFVDKLIDENLKFIEKFYTKYETWISENYEFAYHSNLELEAFIRYIAHYAFLNKPLRHNLETIGNLIGLDQFLNSEQYDEVEEELK